MLNKKTSFNPTTNCAISSFLAGLTFAFSPRYEIFTLGVTNAIALMFKMLFGSCKNEESSKVLKIINKIPVYYLLFLATFPTLVHLRFFQPYNVNRTVDKFIRLGTNGKDQMIMYRGISTFLGFDKK